MRIIGLAILTIAVVGLAAPGGLAAAPKKAPDFLGGGPWFNTGGKPLTIEGLRGKVVAVENVMPDLKKWDARYRDRGLVIVGVHSPEFSYERSEVLIRQLLAEV